jgi:prolyl oligopeptidase
MICKCYNNRLATLPTNLSSIGNDGTLLYIRTNHSAAQYKVVTLDIARHQSQLKDLIPEDPDAYLSQVKIFNKNKLATVYKRNVSVCW